MSTTTAEPRTITPEDLLAMPDRNRYELVDGHLVERAVSALSSLVAVEIGTRLNNHCRPEALAWVFGPDNGYRCFPARPRRVRKADVSVVLRDRLSAERLAESGWLAIPPDLAVEVVSPNDLAEELERRVRDYLGAGTPLVWVVYPSTRSVRVHRADGSERTLLGDDDLDGDPVLPGFRCRIGDLFAAVPAAGDDDEARPG